MLKKLLLLSCSFICASIFAMEPIDSRRVARQCNAITRFTEEIKTSSEQVQMTEEDFHNLVDAMNLIDRIRYSINRRAMDARIAEIDKKHPH